MSKLIASAGPFVGTRNLPDAPFIDASKYLASSTNGYYRADDGVSSWLIRPPFKLPNVSSQIGTGQRTQGQTSFIDPATGSIYRFFVVNGKLYRAQSDFSAGTDVSPVGITIDTGSKTRVAFAAVGSSLVVTDGVNRPWVMSAFASTPVTGAYIDIDGAGGSWSTWGVPAVYQDSVFFIAATVPGGSAVLPRIGIVWCEPNQPTVGYTQSNYADFWNLIETGSDPIQAILGTNNGLFYWRAQSIGLLAGTPSISFSSTATRDARSTAVGTVSPFAVTVFQNNIYFFDASGRPWMMPMLGSPQPIWQQLVAIVDDPLTSVSDLAYYAIASSVPELNQVIMWSGNNFAFLAGTTSASCFEGATGAYAGEWTIGAEINVNSVAIQRDANGLPVLCCAGGKAAGADGGYVWVLSRIADATSAAKWYDDVNSNPHSLYTGLVGYDADTLIQPDSAAFIVRTTDTFFPATGTTWNYPSGSGPLGGVTPITVGIANASQYRAVLGLDGVSTRFVQFQIGGPTLPQSQWGVQRIDLFGTRSKAGVNDP